MNDVILETPTKKIGNGSSDHDRNTIQYHVSKVREANDPEIFAQKRNLLKLPSMSEMSGKKKQLRGKTSVFPNTLLLDIVSITVGHGTDEALLTTYQTFAHRHIQNVVSSQQLSQSRSGESERQHSPRTFPQQLRDGHSSKSATTVGPSTVLETTTLLDYSTVPSSPTTPYVRPDTLEQTVEETHMAREDSTSVALADT